MNIAIAAHFIEQGKVGGAEQALYNLVEGLIRCSAEVTVMVSRKSRLSDKFLEIFTHDSGSRVVETGKFSNRFLGEQVAVLSDIGRYDLTIFPNYHTPFYVPRRWGQVFTIIHDFRYRHYPEYTSWRKRKWLDVSLKRTFRRADKVIAISKETCSDAIQFFGEAVKGRLAVVHNAVSWSQLTDINAAHPLGGTPYILSVAHNWAHKNLATLLTAFAEVRRRRGDTKLVLVGQILGQFRPTHERGVTDLDALARHLGIDDDIVFTGYLSDEGIASYYLHAEIFAFPSYFEGFGLPLVEALGFGVPAVAARREPHVEVSRGKAIYVDDPGDPGAWSDILYKILSDPSAFRPSQDTVEEIRESYAPERIARQIMALSSTIAATSGTRSSTGPGKSCRSEPANGHMGD